MHEPHFEFTIFYPRRIRHSGLDGGLHDDLNLFGVPQGYFESGSSWIKDRDLILPVSRSPRIDVFLFSKLIITWKSENDAGLWNTII